MSAERIERVEGRGLVLRGPDVDTDRIMPARFLRAITFDGLERHVLSGLAKEMGSAAVLLSLAWLVATWILVLA